MKSPEIFALAMMPTTLLSGLSAIAHDVTDRLSLGGVLAGSYQYRFVDHSSGGRDEGGGVVAFQPELSLRPTPGDELFVKLGFAGDNGLNDKTPFILKPWAADLEGDVRSINGRDRDYLLTAWYKHTFQIADAYQLGLTGGIIDATDYLDENVYSNDEYTQFMNSALVNGPNAFLPSYDLGGALEWEAGAYSLKGVVMNVGENDDGSSFYFYGLQLGYGLNANFGEGNYRVILSGASDDFDTPDGLKGEPRGALLLSFDQEFGDILGAFARFGWQDSKARVDHRTIYSGGINLSGRLWLRGQDDIGIAYAHLSGGNSGIDQTQVFEVYLRFVLTDVFAVTADLQYMAERLDRGGGPKGLIPGVRLTAEF